MAIKNKPVKTSARRPRRLMDSQDTSNRGDSKAIRTRRITFSTTDDVADALVDASYERHMSRSKLIEEAIAAYLNL